MDEIIDKITILLTKNLNPNDLQTVRQALQMVLYNYDIQEKKFDLVISDSDVDAKAYQMFFISKKIEGCTDRTMTYYKNVIDMFIHKMQIPLTKATTDDIRYYLAIRGMKDKVSKTTQNNERRILSSFYNWMDDEGYITKSPVRAVKNIKEEKRIKKAFTEIELEKLRDACKNARERAIVETLYSTGSRVSEVEGMNISDIDKDELIVFGKGEKERTVYLNAKAQYAIQNYLKERKDNDPALFVSFQRPYQRIGKGQIEKTIRELGVRAGVPNCHPHRFRRTAATLALNRGMEIEQVQQMLGHEDLKTTAIYAKSETTSLKASHKKFVV